jgi:hypothetical protein
MGLEELYIFEGAEVEKITQEILLGAERVFEEKAMNLKKF